MTTTCPPLRRRWASEVSTWTRLRADIPTTQKHLSGFALQQPLFSLIGWTYIVVEQPYRVGDRVRIEDARGDVVDVDFLVTTLWEIGGELISGNQPSGRIVTLPNSTVLSSQVFNYSWDEFPYVWNELSMQVAYETDLEFARQVMAEEADDSLGDEMAANIQRYREVLDETPVELEVRERPSVDVVQQESWVELRLRYLVHPKRGQAVPNELYERVLARFNEHPDRVGFPVSRNRWGPCGRTVLLAGLVSRNR